MNIRDLSAFALLAIIGGTGSAAVAAHMLRADSAAMVKRLDAIARAAKPPRPGNVELARDGVKVGVLTVDGALDLEPDATAEDAVVACVDSFVEHMRNDAKAAAKGGAPVSAPPAAAAP